MEKQDTQQTNDIGFLGLDIVFTPSKMTMAIYRLVYLFRNSKLNYIWNCFRENSEEEDRAKIAKQFDGDFELKKLRDVVCTWKSSIPRLTLEKNNVLNCFTH